MFDDIRPYRDHEIPAAMQRLAANAVFPILSHFVFPDRDVEVVRNEVASVTTTAQFQRNLMYPAISQIIANSITEFTFSGTEHINPDRKYMYVSNHRDIMLDAALMQYVLMDMGLDTTEITFGANLMQGEAVIDVGKSNKMFKVERPGGSAREFYKSSLHLSEYMRDVLLHHGQSVWIAQRNGRTKDGIDRTDQGIIKMFGMSNTTDKIQSIAELNIMPVSISYEWESCDILKTLELYARLQGPYIKKPGEDLNSILTGILQPKGRVHIHFCAPITCDDLRPYTSLSNNEFHKTVAALMDKRICATYQLTPNNYIAHDLRSGTTLYAGEYTDQERTAFLNYMNWMNKFKEECDVAVLRDIFLGIYANPIDSKLQYTERL